jgi:cell division protease FtsH
MKNVWKSIIGLIVFFFLISFIFSAFELQNKKPERISITKLVEEIKAGSIEKLEIEGNETIHVNLKSGEKQIVLKESIQPYDELLLHYSVTPEELKSLPIEIKEISGLMVWLGPILQFIIPFLLIIGFLYFMSRQVQGANKTALSFGQSRAREIKQKGQGRITFKDVAGVKTAKEELVEVVEFLVNPKKFAVLGAKIPKGVLLMGSPGTGKTLMAKAVAGEANVPFFSISGSEFVEMFVGVGASRVRDLFRKAKKTAPCIIFIDEIDAVGRQRGSGLGGSHDEREQTLNQILVEMDGFEANTGVIVMAATNRPDVLDPALLRPGRFDRRIILDMPDITDRLDILKVHAKNKPLHPDINLRMVAERTPGFSGADLANLLNEAAILAARRNKKKIEQDDIFESVEKVLLGPERKSYILSEKERKITAYHEAGHALVSHILPNADPVHKVSIVSRGSAAGYTLKLPIEDKKMHTRAEFIDDIASLLAGLVAEKQVFNDITTGASSDLRKATQLAKALITEYGMSDSIAPRTYGERAELIFLGKEIHEQRDYSEKTAEKIDEEINRLINGAVTTATEIITKHREKLENIVNLLLKKETIEKKEFEQLFATEATTA